MKINQNENENKKRKQQKMKSTSYNLDKHAVNIYLDIILSAFSI